jgi:carbamoyltransferase
VVNNLAGGEDGISDAGIFDRSFVPANPGNAGLAPGAALALGNGDASSSPGRGYSPFLGPGYDAGEIKAVLDNCKLSYDYLDENRLVDRVIETLRAGRLVGWFQGRMEWGPRALGNRSIVASPLSPYVVDNLSVFLKRREPHRGYSVSVCQEDLERFFDGPPSSAFMEHEYRIKNPDLFPALARHGAKRLRVHTVGDDPPLLRRLLKAFGQATGVPVLVNTSFNGFHEPIVCTPRDAVRIFYGTALDALVLGNFVLEK